MNPTWTEVTLMMLDQVLGEKWGGDKSANLRRIGNAALRMADGVDQRKRREGEQPIEPAPRRPDVIAP